jgi:hypothetical protein
MYGKINPNETKGAIRQKQKKREKRGGLEGMGEKKGMKKEDKMDKRTKKLRYRVRDKDMGQEQEEKKGK